jgi:hypothetical protein
MCIQRDLEKVIAEVEKKYKRIMDHDAQVSPRKGFDWYSTNHMQI